MTREQRLEELVRQFVRLSDSNAIASAYELAAGRESLIASARDVLKRKPEPTTGDADPDSTTAQVLRWMCERGMEHELPDRSELVAGSLETLKAAQVNVVCMLAETYLEPALRDIALAVAYVVEWRRQPADTRTPAADEALGELWHSMSRHSHILSKAIRIQFELIDGAESTATVSSGGADDR